jgi:hypothetical protein
VVRAFGFVRYADAEGRAWGTPGAPARIPSLRDGVEQKAWFVGYPLPVAWAGVWTGNRLHVRLAPTTIARIIGAVLFVIGATLIVRTL